MKQSGLHIIPQALRHAFLTHRLPSEDDRQNNDGDLSIEDYDLANGIALTRVTLGTAFLLTAVQMPGDDMLALLQNTVIVASLWLNVSGAVVMAKTVRLR